MKKAYTRFASTDNDKNKINKIVICQMINDEIVAKRSVQMVNAKRALAIIS